MMFGAALALRLAALVKLDVAHWQPGDVPFGCSEDVAYWHVTEGQGKDIVELAVIQADESFRSWLTYGDSDEKVDIIEVDGDRVYWALVDWAPWLPIGAGW